MKRVLVYGYNGVSFGGVEQMLLEYIRTITAASGEITFDVLIAGDICNREDRFLNMGCRVLYYPIRRKDIKAYNARMDEIFEQTKYDAIWCNASGLTNIDVLIKAKKQGIPVRVVHSHVAHLMWGSPIMRILVPLMHHRNKLRLSNYATHYWACSQKAGEFMFPASVHDQIYVVKNAIDTDIYYPRPDVRAKMREQFGFEGLVVGHTARLSKEKNQRFMLQVMRAVVDRDPKAKLLLVGDGDLRGELEVETARLGLQNNVVFTGFRTDIVDLLQAADVFMLPSLAEGLGLSAIEAQACGLPCVVSATVPGEVDISGAVRFVPLEVPVEQWADAVFDMAKKKIDDPAGCVRAAGYQISATAKSVYKVFKGE